MRQWAGTKIERLWRFIRRHVAAKAGNFPAAGATHEEDEELRISLFSDGADLAGILEMYEKPWIRGFTTNPTLMRKAGVLDYEAFCAGAAASGAGPAHFPWRLLPTTKRRWSCRR